MSDDLTLDELLTLRKALLVSMHTTVPAFSTLQRIEQLIRAKCGVTIVRRTDDLENEEPDEIGLPDGARLVLSKWYRAYVPHGFKITYGRDGEDA